MHEFSVSLDMLRIIEESTGSPCKLTKVQVTLGPLSGINADSLSFCFPEATAQEGWGRPELIINTVPARALCGACEKEYELEDMMNLTCPYCGSMERVILSGQEFTLDHVEFEEE